MRSKCLRLYRCAFLRVRLPGKCSIRFVLRLRFAIEYLAAGGRVSGMSMERTLLAAQGYLELGLPQEALAELDSLVTHDQERAVILHFRLFLLMRAHRWSEGVEVCDRLRRLWPDDTAGFIHGAFCLHELGRTADAKAVLLAGPASLAHEATYFYNLACYDTVLDNFDEATALLNASFEIDEKFRDFAKADPDLKPLHETL